MIVMIVRVCKILVELINAKDLNFFLVGFFTSFAKPITSVACETEVSGIQHGG
jgi:hypothetical protein